MNMNRTWQRGLHIGRSSDHSLSTPFNPTIQASFADCISTHYLDSLNCNDMSSSPTNEWFLCNPALG
jgi:hypothetical protein